MEVSFTLHVPPFSLNNMYYKKTFNRTRDAREWSTLVFQQLQGEYVQQQINKFKEKWSPKGNSIRVNLIYRYPIDKLITKDMNISSRSMDCTNVEKPLVDLMFAKKYHERSFPEGCPNFNIDDKVVIKCISEKVPSRSGEYEIGVTVESVNFIEEWKEILEEYGIG